MTEEELVRETVEYYRTHPIAVNFDRGVCQYLTEDGRMCAVGRCAIDPSMMEQEFAGKGVKKIPNLDDKLKLAYRGFSYHTWSDLQSLHDRKNFWEKNNSGDNVLTTDGKEFIERAFGFVV